jgi:signal transduction histidine kinase/ActR/RegA family two-component response regulator
MATKLAATTRQLRATKAELASQLAGMQRLHALSVRLSSHADLSTLLGEVLNGACDLQGATMGLLLIYDPERHSLKPVASAGMHETFVQQLGRVAVGSGPWGTAVALRQPVAVHDIETDERFAEDRPLAEASGYRAVYCVPLQARTGQIVGAMATFFAEPHTPSARDRQLVEMYGSQASEFIENARHYEDLRDASRLKDEFLATLSHEIRTPLNAVLGWASLLRRTHASTIDEKSAHALEAIERNSRVQSQLVEDLLDISRIVTGKMRLSFSPVDLRAVIYGALDTVRPAAENKRLQLTHTVSADDVTVFGDAARLQQVVWNLLANAVHCTPEGGHISVRVEQSTGGIAITIADDGCGIPSTLLPHVFERFRQGDGAGGPSSRRGLGLGLAIVRHLVEAHGGRVEASSPGVGMGATFTVTLPAAEAAAPQAATPAPSPSTAPSLAGYRILLVEDDMDSRDLLTTALETYGATVHAVASGVDALASLSAGGYHALIADIGMADMNGYALMRTIRALGGEQGRRLPAIALTVYASSREREEALAAGFDEHIAKPIEPERIATMLATVIAGGPPEARA